MTIAIIVLGWLSAIVAGVALWHATKKREAPPAVSPISKEPSKGLRDKVEAVRARDAEQATRMLTEDDVRDLDVQVDEAIKRVRKIPPV